MQKSGRVPDAFTATVILPLYKGKSGKVSTETTGSPWLMLF